MASGGLPHQLLPPAAFLAHFGKDSQPAHNNAPLFDNRGAISAGIPAPTPLEIHPRPIISDEKDAFISWLRSEFAAANAIIDAMCHHLCMVGEPSEYDHVFTCIQQRRYNWTVVLHMQQFFSVAEVVYALQQATWRKQQARNAGQSQPVQDLKNSRMPSKNETAVVLQQIAVPHVIVPDLSTSNTNTTGSCLPQDVPNSKAVQVLVQNVDNSRTSSDSQSSSFTAVEQPLEHSYGYSANPIGTEPHEGHELCVDSQKKESLKVSSRSSGPYAGKPLNFDFITIPKEEHDVRLPTVKVSKKFQHLEQVDGKLKNVVEGLELYDNVLNHSETTQLAYLIAELQSAGRRGELAGRTFISDDALKGSVREIIQFVYDSKTSSGEIGPMPVVFKSLVDRLLLWGIIPAKRKPDYCSIKVLEQGESISTLCHQHVDQFLCCLSVMANCTLLIGHNTAMDNGDYKNRFKLQLPSGSAIILQGNSASEAVSRVILPSKEKRMMVTFGKLFDGKPKTAYSSPPRNTTSASNGQALPAGTTGRSSPIGVQPTNVHSVMPALMKHYGIGTATGVLPSSGVLPIPTIRPFPQSPPSHSQGAVITNPLPARPYSAIGVMNPTGWSAVPPRAPRPPNSGTGVFFPSSGSSNSGAKPVQGGVVMVPSQKPETSMVPGPIPPTATDAGRVGHRSPSPAAVATNATTNENNDKSIDVSLKNTLASNDTVISGKPSGRTSGTKVEANGKNKSSNKEEHNHQTHHHHQQQRATHSSVTSTSTATTANVNKTH